VAGSVKRDRQPHGHGDEGQGADPLQAAEQGIEAVGHPVVAFNPLHQQGIHHPHHAGGQDHQQPALAVGEPLPQGRGGGQPAGLIGGEGREGVGHGVPVSAGMGGAAGQRRMVWLKRPRIRPISIAT